MKTPLGHARALLPRLAAPSRSDSQSRSLLQQRIPLFAKSMFFLFGICFALAALFSFVFPGAMPHDMVKLELLAVYSLGALGATWVLSTRTTHSDARLRALDVAIMVGSAVTIGGGSFLTAERPEHIIVPFTFAVLLSFARVFILPSSTLRTACVTGICMAGVTLGNLGAIGKHPDTIAMPMAAFATGGVVLAAATVALATLGTSVIYGLRREVAEARRFGQYTLEKKLGDGGMGVVYMARHAMLRRATALKLLRPDRASSADIARFEREVQLTAELTHPNTIAIFDYGRTADGVFYYVMEYVDGIDLERLVAEYGPLPPARTIHILVQMCEALDEAHVRGIVHRDIKPANILLCRRGQVPDFVKVVDFGLVKEVARAEKVTLEGTFAGTPAYIAPEVVTSSAPSGPPGDLYALGAVGYFLLTGQLVFEGRTAFEICSHHVNTRPVPPSKRTDRPIPAELERILLGCLEKSPGDRPASARALADSLAAIPDVSPWPRADALAWWEAFHGEREQKALEPETSADADVALADTVAVEPDPMR